MEYLPYLPVLFLDVLAAVSLTWFIWASRQEKLEMLRRSELREQPSLA